MPYAPGLGTATPTPFGASSARLWIMFGTLLTATALAEFAQVPRWIAPVLVLVALGIGTSGYLRLRNDLRQICGAAEALAAGDLSSQQLPSVNSDLGRIALGLDAVRNQLAELSDELQRASEDREAYVHDSFIQQRDAEEYSRHRAQEVVATTSKAVIRELREVVDGVEEVRAAAGTIDERVSGAHTVAQAVVEKAEQANRVAEDLSSSLEKVAGMAQLIAGIADQTKLLALNANIEAVRAGTVGKGFEVVAGEVKNLAMTTASSTERISSIIVSIERDANEMSRSIAGVVESIADVDTATSGLTQIADEQRRTVEQLNASMAHTINRLEAMERIGEELERRGNERIPFQGPVEVRIGTELHSGELTDLSESGVGVRLPGGPDVERGTEVEVVFRVGELEVRESATVVRVRTVSRDRLTGMRFTRVTDATQTVLRGEVQRRLTPLR